MNVINSVLEFFKSPAGAAMFAGLFALSEAIGAIPSVKASNVYQAVFNGLGWVKKTFFGPKIEQK